MLCELEKAGRLVQHSFEWIISDSAAGPSQTWLFLEVFVAKNFSLWSYNHQCALPQRCICKRNKSQIRPLDLIFVKCVRFKKYLVAFFGFLLLFFSCPWEPFLWVFTFKLFPDIVFWRSRSFSAASDDARVGERSKIDSWVKILAVSTGEWGFLTTILEWISCILCEAFSCVLAWDNWMEQGRTSQRKCMWAGTWAKGWCGDTEESETTKAEEEEGPGWDDPGPPLRRAETCGQESLCENSGTWEPPGCCRLEDKKYYFKRELSLINIRSYKLKPC